MDGCIAIKFVKHVKIGFVQVGVVCAAWWYLRELSQQSNLMHPHCFVYYDKTWMETVLTCFTKTHCWTAIPGSIWTTSVPVWKRNKYAIIHNCAKHFMICLFEFERFSIESRFPSFFLYSYCTVSFSYFAVWCQGLNGFSTAWVMICCYPWYCTCWRDSTPAYLTLKASRNN